MDAETVMDALGGLYGEPRARPHGDAVAELVLTVLSQNTSRKTADIRPIITLQCGECRERNYTSVKNRRNDPQRLELRKYCSRCRTHRAHREVR